MRSPALRLILFSTAALGALGVWLPYWPKWLDARGMSAAQIGVLTGAWSWSRALSGPFVAHFADSSGRYRPWLIATSAGGAAVFALYALGHSFAALFALSLAFGAAQSVTIPLSENLTLRKSREHGFSYGAVRAWGSLAFLAVAVVLGTWIDSSGTGVIHPAMLALLALAALWSFGLPEVEPRPRVERRAPLRALFSSRPAVATLLGCGIVLASHATYTAFSTLHWTAAGHSTTTVGLLWAEGVIAEIALFAVAPRVASRFGERGLLWIGAGGAAVRWIALASSTHIAVLAGTQWMHALSFAAVHLAVMGFLSRAVALELSATAMSLYSTFVHASNALAVSLAGSVYERSAAAAFALMSAVALAGAWLADAGLRASRADGASPRAE
jgi:PPP family 3-phenylpropionic acid transporter